MMRNTVIAACAALLLALTGAWAFKPAVDTVGPLTLTIAPVDPVKQLDSPFPVAVSVENKGDAAVSGDLRLEVIDNWRIEAPAQRRVTIAAHAKSELVFSAVAGRGSYAAHYPIHAWLDFALDGKAAQAHAVAVTAVAPAAVAPSSRAAVPAPLVVALRTATAVTLDGDLAEWSKAIPIPLGDSRQSVGTFAPGEFGALLYALHDDSTLYLAVRVTDREIVSDDTTSRDFMNSDYLRLYLAAQDPAQRQAARLSSDDLVVAINPFAAGGPLLKVPDYDLATRPLAAGLLRVAPRRTATGYEAELAVPLAALGADLRDGSRLGLNLMVGDAGPGGRRGEITLGTQAGEYWTSPQSYATLELSPRTEDDGLVSLPVTALSGRTVLALDRLGLYRLQVERPGAKVKSLPLAWTGADAETGANFAAGQASRPDQRPALVIHPPYRTGAGNLWADARFALPEVKPITLSFATAIRDNTAAEPPSDGVEWRVYAAAEGGQFQQLFQRFSAAKAWEPAEVDLSAYAGQTITLRLYNGPGPAGNTTCDSGYWAEPTLTVGAKRALEKPEELARRRSEALARARAALQGKSGPFQWTLSNAAGKFGVGWTPGTDCFANGCLAFATADRSVVCDSFLLAIDGAALGDWRSNARAVGSKATWSAADRTATIADSIEVDGRAVPVQVRLSAAAGALRVKFAMPGVKRSARGEPRFTLLGPGPWDHGARRVYAGFGNVLQDPQKFSLGQSGFGLSTRHVGLDFDNGLSLVQASDVVPYRLSVDPEQRLYSLQTGHDATLTFIPSTRGAFAAARVYHGLSGFKPAGGVEKLKGKMVIDWWGGHEIAADLRRAGAYGLNDSVFIKHAWQRWGYDYRLPDIYPPSCDPKVWNDWVTACKQAGMLCGVHDNYIDFYPDASGYSYKHILFNADGTPQRAWWNPGPEAQSYRWLPGAYQPWLERNLRHIKQGFAPTAYFIDVFTAHPTLDYYDQQGNFHTKMECGQKWGECFDYVRKTLGDNAPQICEAGHDALIGHLDGAQSDHFTAPKWGWKSADYERVPWHDMGTHGTFVLLAGGLGDRYASDEPNSSWASDNYLSNTVLGGRNPMCTGPCTRGTVLTYWLQHDLCNLLARQDFLSHEFVGDDIHRQHTTFSGGGETWVNRGDTPWTVAGVTLPKYGYLARSGDTVSAIKLIDGLRAGYAHSPAATFVDSRPDYTDATSRAPVKTHVLGAKYLGAGKVEVEIEWEVLKPLPGGTVAFVHLSHDKAAAQGSEKIAVHPPHDLSPALLQRPGTYVGKSVFTITDDLYDGEYRLRYGLFRPEHGGERLAPIADLENTRVRGGSLIVTKANGKVTAVEYVPQTPAANAPQLNTEGKLLDFGGIATNGAFRLLHDGKSLRLLPLQGSLPFQAQIRLDQFGAKGKRVTAVAGLDQAGTKLKDERFVQEGNVLKLDLDASCFSYAIRY